VVKLPPKKFFSQKKGEINDHPRKAYQKKALIARACRFSEEYL